ncbi:hypothetical protein [Amycolatopsis sp. cg13]|uniref:hypothetical protein n=1 Tax=Amycolatopsis sp. cg13 TaxID=3238807 RepID=UPI003524D80A
MLWLAWLVLTEWVPMFPLNDLAPGNLRPRLLAAALALCVLILAGHDVVPDVQHLVVGLLTLVMLGTTLAATLTA